VRRPRLSLTDAAVNDILEQADWYEQQADARLSDRWERAISQTLLRIIRNPRSGTLCSLAADQLRGVRYAPVTGFAKQLVFYLVEKDELRVLRVIHGARDLERLF